MISKRKINAFITFNWYWFLLIFAICSMFFYYLFDVLKKPTYDERINVFIAIDYINKDNMEKDLYVGFENSEIKEISIDYSNPNDYSFSMVFSTRGLVNTDILILPSTYIESQNYAQYFIELNEKVIEKYIFTSIDYIKNQDVFYGIDVTNFINNYTEENSISYHLFFNKKSTKIGELSLTNQNNDYALKILSNIFRG